METEAKNQIRQWRDETVEKPLQSAQQVQDRLLDLYATLRAYPVISEVEKWLGLTRERSLFEGKEIVELLDEIETELAVESLGLEEPTGA
jgi:peptide subunit release factor RF-3